MKPRFLAYGPYKRGSELSTPRGIYAVGERQVLIVDTQGTENVIERRVVPEDFPADNLASPPGVATVPLSDETAGFDEEGDLDAWWGEIFSRVEEDEGRPRRNASTNDWFDFRVGQGYSPDALAGLNRDALIELSDEPAPYETPPEVRHAVGDAPPAEEE